MFLRHLHCGSTQTFQRNAGPFHEEYPGSYHVPGSGARRGKQLSSTTTTSPPQRSTPKRVLSTNQLLSCSREGLILDEYKTESSGRVEIQFDYDHPTMAGMRTFTTFLKYFIWMIVIL